MNKIKLHKKYKPLFGSDSRYYIATGGRGSGKSFSISTFLCMLLAIESGHVILFTRYTMSSAHISIIPEFIDKISELGLSDEFEITKESITNKTTGSKIIFKGIRTSSGDQTANLKSLQGVTTWVCDEAEEIVDENIFDKINLSIRVKGKQNRVILILNPSTKEHWIYKRFFVDNGVNQGWNGTKNNVTYIHTTYLDNAKNLDESFITEIELTKLNNPKKYDHVILGGWLDKAEGVIFTNWMLGDFDNQLEFGYGADFGYSNDPSTLIKVAIDKKNKIIYLDEKMYLKKQTTSDLSTIFGNECSNKEIIADNSENRLIDEIKKAGPNIKPCVKGAGSVGEGIILMQDYKIMVTPTSTNLIKEFNNYVWNDKKSGTPVDMYNHAIDAARYYISHILKKPTGRYNFK